MWAVVCHSKVSINFDEFVSRYKLFGGIIRNILGEDDDAEEKLVSRLQHISLRILSSIALDVDEDNNDGSTVSGYLVCYDHKWDKGETRDDFSTKTLEYTSLAVEDAVMNKLRVLSTVEKMQGVLHRLDRELIDLSGKMLENAAMELLSRGTAHEWQSCEVGGSSWVQFKITKKSIRRTFTIGENLSQPDMIIAPTRTNFPLVDFLCTSSDMSRPIIAFQCTWNTTHPMTVRALYDLRCEQMKIPDTQILTIYLASPDNEENYKSKDKMQFLEGSLDVDLQWTRGKLIPAATLKTLWGSTRIHVLRPLKSWQETIRVWLAENQ